MVQMIVHLITVYVDLPMSMAMSLIGLGDWERLPVEKTGPATDHTTLRFGFFMYIETSNPRQDGDRAILQSKLFLPSGDSGERCLQFYYHMYGEHIGELKVLYSESDDIDKELWRETKNMGNQWHLKGVQLPPGSSPYRVKFVGIRGSGYQGDVAIDDVFFTDGKCPPNANITP
ncbi:Meprin A subunit beta [Desmophyllum pertusum]|uniref:Meprin A subunit beta n=1 Tax=Desmophyllum pertusum TaxID=174260 RepID=A0A9X0CFZ7_9CNID|nr:Meprin A subunit beta [Desmophyllum pertusum]